MYSNKHSKKKKYPNTRQSAHLNSTTYRTRPPTADTHKPQIKSKKKKRESRLPFSRRPSAGRWRLSCPVPTCSSSARPLVTLFRHLWPSAFTSAFSRHENSEHSLAHTHSHLCTQTSQKNSFSLSTLFPALFLGAFHLSTNRERTRSPPPAFLVTETGSFFISFLRYVLLNYPFPLSLCQQALSSIHSSTVRPSSWAGVLAGNLSDAEPRLHPSRW